MVLTELTEDDDLSQLLLEAEQDGLSMTTTPTAPPSMLEAPSFGEDLINGSTSSPNGSPAKTTNPLNTVSTPSNGFSDKLNRSALAAEEDKTAKR